VSVTGLALQVWLLLAAQAPDSVPAAELARREHAAWRLIATLQSPFCPGLTLESCPSWYADSLRTEIRQRMARGESSERMRIELAREFGQRVLGEPTWEGFDVVGWVGPWLLLLLSGGVLLAVLRRRGSSVPAPTFLGRPDFVPSITPLSEEERATLEGRLTEELGRDP
jgi:cytochrome c-type biogenesis protein CcmH